MNDEELVESHGWDGGGMKNCISGVRARHFDERIFWLAIGRFWIATGSIAWQVLYISKSCV